MQPRHVLRALALAFLVAAPVLAQSTRRVVVNGAAPSAAPASGGAAAPAATSVISHPEHVLLTRFSLSF